MKEIKLNDDYYIILDKKDNKIWNNKRICYFYFLNSFKLPILSFNANEEDIRRFIECIYDFIESQSGCDKIYFNSSELLNALNSFGFEFLKDSIFQVIEYNPYIDLYNPRLKIILDENNYNLKNFATDVYYEFLSDKKEYLYLVPDFLN